MCTISTNGYIIGQVSVNCIYLSILQVAPVGEDLIDRAGDFCLLLVAVPVRPTADPAGSASLVPS